MFAFDPKDMRLLRAPCKRYAPDTNKNAWERRRGGQLVTPTNLSHAGYGVAIGPGCYHVTPARTSSS